MFPRRWSPALLCALLAPCALAQQAVTPVPPAVASQPIDLRYTGAAARLGLGYDTENKLRGDAYYVFSETERSAWIGEMWFSDRTAGGLQASYQWQPDGDRAAGVRKAFVAVDQNQWRDRKVTLGGGYETANWFASAYGSAGISGRRQVAFDETTTMSTQSGTDATGQFNQDIFTTVTRREFERAYDGGVGGRIGHFYEDALVRVDGGLDYEWGRGGANQATIAIGVEKFFAGSPFSVGLVGEAYHKQGDFETDRSDQRLTVMVRYEFGGPAWRPAKQYRQVRVDAPAAVATAAAAPAAAVAAPTTRVEKRIVKTTASASSDAFFGFDRADLRPEAKSALDNAIARIKARGFEGNIRISGHTCDIGTDAYNLKLSERRAQSVKAYLAASGIDAGHILAEGMGKANPRYPNDAEGRPKNRRVDIEFVTYEDKVQDVTVNVPAPAAATPPAAATAPVTPAVEWRQEEIASEPAWVRRALRNTPKHKQTVDVYKTQELTTQVTQGDKHYLNHPPVASPDAFTVSRDSTGTFDVLANDHDPDGDALAIVSVTAPQHGIATVSGARVVYTPAAGYIGPDTFSYTVNDGKGLTASATVTVTVIEANHPPIARDDFGISGLNTPLDMLVLANDTDPDGDPLTIVSFTQPANGTVTRSDHNTLIYTAKFNYVGMDAYTYTISDGRGGTATANVSVYADP